MNLDTNILVLILIIFLFAFKGKFFSMFYKYKNISKSEANELVKNKNAVLIDVRTAQEFNSGHIDGSKNVPVNIINRDIESLINKYSKDPVILVCASGMRSTSAAIKFVKKGHKEVYNISGGIA